MASAQVYVEPPEEGRRYAMHRRVRLGDVGPHGRVRLDAVARHLQDIAGEDGDDSGVGGVWVLRRTALRFTGSWPRMGETVGLVTFCSGTGSRWAERRTVVNGDRGRIDSAAIWVLVDPRSGRPQALPPSFRESYGAAAGDRTVTSRLTVPAPGPGLPARPWQVRFTDLDVLGHVNNARYWEAVEDELAARGGGRVLEATMEFRTALEPGDEPEVVSEPGDGALRVWLRSPKGLHAACELSLGPV